MYFVVLTMTSVLQELIIFLKCHKNSTFIVITVLECDIILISLTSGALK